MSPVPPLIQLIRSVPLRYVDPDYAPLLRSFHSLTGKGLLEKFHHLDSVEILCTPRSAFALLSHQQTRIRAPKACSDPTSSRLPRRTPSPMSPTKASALEHFRLLQAFSIYAHIARIVFPTAPTSALPAGREVSKQSSDSTRCPVAPFSNQASDTSRQPSGTPVRPSGRAVTRA